MAKSKSYRVIAPVGVVGFKGVIHKTGDIIEAGKAPEANIKVWLRFGQVEEVTEEKVETEKAEGEETASPARTKGKK